MPFTNSWIAILLTFFSINYFVVHYFVLLHILHRAHQYDFLFIVEGYYLLLLQRVSLLFVNNIFSLYLHKVSKFMVKRCVQVWWTESNLPTFLKEVNSRLFNQMIHTKFWERLFWVGWDSYSQVIDYDEIEWYFNSWLPI